MCILCGMYRREICCHRHCCSLQKVLSSMNTTWLVLWVLTPCHFRQTAEACVELCPWNMALTAMPPLHRQPHAALQARTHRARREFNDAIKTAQEALRVSEQLGEHSGDVDTLGMLADMHVDIGEIEKASKLYDRVIGAIQQEDLSTALSSAWDC